jgi:quercetin dioxygenase-like cupin family protein
MNAFTLRKATGVALAFAAIAAGTVAAQSPQTGHGHMMTSPDQLKWADAPSVGPGARIAVIEGPLNEPVPFTFRLKLPANMKVAPHVHPTFERVTVLSGTFHFAHGDTYDASKTTPLAPGSVAIMPPGAPMFGYTTDETVIQLHGTGPWGISYVNPADDPRKK